VQLRHHRNWVHDFVQAVGPKTEAPERFLYWSAVATVSGALRRRCYLEMGTFRWYSNWYIVLVGPPGLVKKSTTIDIATKLLRGVEGVVFGPDCTTWQEFVAWVARSEDTFNRGTAGSSILDQESEQTCAVTFAISEFGTFFDARDRLLINMLTELWDCKDTPFVKSTKTQGQDVIKAPFVNLITGTTPDWIAANFTHHFSGWGLSSRIIFLHANKLEKLVPYPDEVWGSELQTWAASFQADLRAIAQLEGSVRISEDARGLGREFYKELMSRIEHFNESAYTDKWVSYYLQRKFAHAHKLALVLSVAEGDSYVIERRHLQEAILRCNEVEEEISHIFTGVRDTDRRRHLIVEMGQGIAKGLLRSGPCPQDRIYRYTYQFMDGRQTDDLIKQMIASGFIERVQDSRGVLLHLTEAGRGLLPAALLGEIEEEIAQELAAMEEPAAPADRTY